MNFEQLETRCHPNKTKCNQQNAHSTKQSRGAWRGRALPWPSPVSLASSFLLLNLLEQIVRDEDDDQMDPEMFCAVMQRAHLDRPSNLNHVCILFFLLISSMHISLAIGCVCAYELQQPLMTSLFTRYCNRGKELGRRPFNDSLRRQRKLLAAYWMYR